MYQGLAGGVLAVAALLGAHAFLAVRSSETLLVSFLAAEFLSPGKLVALIGLGAIAGLIGAIASLRKEDLGQTAEATEWSSEE